MTSTTDIHSNQVIEWYAKPHNLFLGLVDNIEPERRIGRVVTVKSDYAIVFPADAQDAYSSVRVRFEDITAILAEQAEAGWGSLA